MKMFWRRLQGGAMMTARIKIIHAVIWNILEVKAEHEKISQIRPKKVEGNRTEKKQRIGSIAHCNV